jgi:hypothetical protein
MTEQMSGARRITLADGLAMTALLLKIGAVVASALCLATFALGATTTAVTAGAVALAALAASIAGFAADGRLRIAAEGASEAATPERTPS